MRTLVTTLAFLIAAAPAAAQVAAQPAGAEATVSRGAVVVDGKNEISAQLGFQASLGATTPAGIRLNFDYARRLTNLLWLNFKLAPVFGVGPNRAVCQDRGGLYDCGSGGYALGHAIDVIGGVKLKFPIARIPALIPYAQLGLGAAIMFNRPANDNGAGFVFRTGGGLKYFVTKNIGLGGELSVTMGPAWYSETCTNCNNGHTEFYRAIDFALGAEFVL
jgi:hypothetical protein